MSMASRIERIEKRRWAEFLAWLKGATDRELEQFLDWGCSKEGRELLAEMSDAQVEQLARGNDSWLTDEQREALETPLPLALSSGIASVLRER